MSGRNYLPARRYALISLLLLAGALSRLCASDTHQGKSGWLKKLANKLPAGNAPSGGQGTTVAGVRGLEESSGPVDTRVRDYPAVDRLEKARISEAELAAFVKEGGLE
jgi:hypothetical protein